MKGFARFISSILLVMFLVVLPFSLLFFNIGRMIFNRPLLKSVLTEATTQTNFIPVALAWYSEELSKELPVENEVALDIAVVFASLDQEAWEAIQKEVLPDDILVGWVSKIVDDFHAWMDSETSTPTLKLDLTSFKARVNSDHGLRTLEIAYNVLPACQSEQVTEFESKLQTSQPGSDVYYPPCQFPEPYRESQLTDYLNSIREVVDSIPDVVEFPDPVNGTQDSGQNWATIKQALRLLRLFYWLVLLIPILLLVFVWRLVIRSARDFARWWGIPLMLGGIATIFLAWFSRALLSSFLVGNVLQDVPETMQTEFRAILDVLFDTIFSPMMIQAVAILLAGGAVLIIVGGMMGRQQIANQKKRSRTTS